MGVSSSNQLPPGHKSLDLGEVLVSLTEVPAPSYWKAEPRVILANRSDYIVSYWVIEEETKRTKAQHQRVANSIISRHLNAICNSKNSTSSTGGNLSGKVDHRREEDFEPEQQQQQEEEEEEEDEVYFLTRDHRMGRKGSTQPTQVPFPVNCQHVRVFGFFERNGEWHCYKDKLYSIALRNKSFHVMATTSNVATLYSKKLARATKLSGKQVT